MRLGRWAFLAAGAVAAWPAVAVDFSFSSFGTVGYARSNQPFTYQRFIDENGTFRRDSVAGVQGDARFGEHWGATLQLKAAPAPDRDDVYKATASWAFVSFRPTNEWLIRVGKQRIPLYLYSENIDVGTTYEFARLPTEMYSIVSSNDALALSVSRTWSLANGELALDGYWGKSNNDLRVWHREGLPPTRPPGASFIEEHVTGLGLVLSFRRHDDIYRVSAHRATFRFADGGKIATNFPFVPLAPGIGYYQVDDAFPGPGVPAVDAQLAMVYTLGGDVGVGKGFRVVGEFARTVIPGNIIGAASDRFYLALSRRIDALTPYVSFAAMRSPGAALRLRESINANRVPPFVPNADIVNASQRFGADSMLVYDQHSWAIGASYSFSATSKLKAEVMRTRIGQVSGLVDAPPGSDIRDRNIDVLSVSYNFVF
jgi:hypothetical protein